MNRSKKKNSYLQMSIVWLKLSTGSRLRMHQFALYTFVILCLNEKSIAYLRFKVQLLHFFVLFYFLIRLKLNKKCSKNERIFCSLCRFLCRGFLYPESRNLSIKNTSCHYSFFALNAHGKKSCLLQKWQKCQLNATVIY